MKYFLSALIICFASICCNAQYRQTCLNTEIMGTYAIEGWATFHLDVDGGGDNFTSWGGPYEDEITGNLYFAWHVIPHSYGHYKVYVKKKLLGMELSTELMDEFDTYLPELVLNSPVSGNYVAKAVSAITLMPGFSCDASSTTSFTTQFVSCALRIGSFGDDASNGYSSETIPDKITLFNVFPNPNKFGVLGIRTSKDILPGVVSIYNASGLKIMESNITVSEEFVNIESINKPGIYFLKFTSPSGKVFDEKLIIE